MQSNRSSTRTQIPRQRRIVTRKLRRAIPDLLRLCHTPLPNKTCMGSNTTGKLDFAEHVVVCLMYFAQNLANKTFAESIVDTPGKKRRKQKLNLQCVT
jgi:hypothetical protein